MKFLRSFLDKYKPAFEKGGKYHALHSLFAGVETFLYVPDRVTRSGCAIRDAIDLKRTMSVVVLALVPALLFGMYNVGYQHALATGGDAGFWSLFFHGFLRVFPLLVVSYVVGLGIEFTAAQLRGHEINEGFLVSGLLIPMVMPVTAPLWMVALSTAFAVIIGKEIFGGTGMNIWNPALLARAFFFFSYPSRASGDKVWVDGLPDGVSSATPLAEAYQGMPFTHDLETMFWGFVPGSIGETSTFCILLGAALLLVTGVGSWKIMLSILVGGAGTALLLQHALPDANPYSHVTVT
ncbi:MAG: RnfABCDGE type electron transport complex subunit D, partial [Odoribacteraceae bacterium]|nr:RnfABCDGE type electron transport complex subunit D [Odoribacteraceae bacterium]